MRKRFFFSPPLRIVHYQSEMAGKMFEKAYPTNAHVHQFEISINIWLCMCVCVCAFQSVELNIKGKYGPRQTTDGTPGL